MSYEEATRLVSRISAAFPRHRFSPETVAIYTDMLVEFDLATADRAVHGLLAESEFPPTIASIRTRIAEATLGLPDPETAWALVTRRWGDHSGAGDPTVQLPTEVQTALSVAGIDAYRYWTSDNQAFLRRDFVSAYEAIYRRLLRATNLGVQDTWISQISEAPPNQLGTGILKDIPE